MHRRAAGRARGWSTLAALLTTVTVGACTTPATYVQVVVDTDGRDRVLSMRALVSRGSSPSQTPAQQSWARTGTAQDFAWPASFSITPGSAANDSVATLQLEVTFGPATPGQPVVTARRTARFHFTPHTPSILRLYVPVSCTNEVAPPAHCMQANPCTVSAYCEEQSPAATCGDEGRCGTIDVTPTPVALDDGGSDIALDRPDVVDDAPDVTDVTDATDAPDAVDVVDAADGQSPCGTCAAGRTCCGTQCVDLQSDPMHCGTCGTNCPAVTNGMPACSSGVCGAVCAAGFHDCAGACVADTSVMACGSSCTPCTAPSNATATCDGVSCGVMCNAGFTLCGGACVDTQTDIANCGACGTACAYPTANGTALCALSTCGFACDATCTADLAMGTCVCPSPRQIAPLSSALVTSQLPTLRWVLGAGTDAVEATLCRDRAMTSMCQTFTATGTSGRPGTALAPGVWFWQLHARSGGSTGPGTSAVWEFVAPARSSPFDLSWGTVLDPNGDGFPDLLVGEAGLATTDGGGRIFYGSASGFGATGTALSIGRTGARYGLSAASVGDVDGDGFPEAVLGGSDFHNPYRAGPSGLATMPRFVQGEGPAVTSSGDHEGDGYADYWAGDATWSSGMGSAWRFIGSGTSFTIGTSGVFGPDANGEFGASLAGNGDINGDGRPDLVVGSPGSMTNTGRVFVHYGNTLLIGVGTTAGTALAGSGSGRFGASVAMIGDVNWDGYCDVAVGEPLLNSSRGRVSVFHGSAAGLSMTPAVTIDGPTTNSSFGASVAAIGDVNGDGYPDLGVGAPQLGAIYAYVGGPSGISNTVWQSRMEGAASRLGASIVPLTDMDGDGLFDFGAGAPGASAGGEVHLWRSTGAGLSLMTIIVAGPDGMGSQFGEAVAWNAFPWSRARRERESRWLDLFDAAAARTVTWPARASRIDRVRDS